MEIKRREFLRTSLAGLGGAVAVGSAQRSVLAQETPKQEISTDPFELVQLTPTIKASRIGLGTGMAGYNQSSTLTRMDRNNAIKVINHCYDVGVRFFDCADLYGTHDLISSTLKDKPRDSYVLSSKIWLHNGGIKDEDRQPVRETVMRFLKEMRTDYIDLVQLHCMMKPDWANDFQDQAEELEKLKKEGLIRGHGVSCHSIGAIQTAAENPWVDAIHIRLNHTGYRMEGSAEENIEASKKAHANGKGILCMKIMGEGTYKELEERRKSVDFVARAQIVDVYVVAFEQVEHVDEFVDNLRSSLEALKAEQA
ncbi:MAG: aldo/keto reductase [Planctomycetia bacterium]|nr:aldo/keto reductase [Planctomycetia bacterium]